MSKGSKSRPFQVANEQYAQRWDLIFGRDNEKKNKQENLDADQSSTSRHIGGGDHRNQSVGQVKGEGACGN